MSPQTIHFWVWDKSPLSGPRKGPPSCNKWWLWQDLSFATTNILTTLGDQLNHQWTRPSSHNWYFCPWSPDAEYSDGVRSKRLYWPLSPFFFLSSFQPLLSYPSSFARSWIQQSNWRASAWSEGWAWSLSVGRELKFCLVLYLVSEGFSGDSVVKNWPANVGDMDSVPRSGRYPGEGNGNPLQYSCLGNPMDREA